MSKEAFCLAVKNGGPDCSTVITPRYEKLKAIFKSSVERIYCEEIDVFSFIFRGDGEFQQFNFEGISGLELNFGERFITIDIGIPLERWKNKKALEVAEYLISCLNKALS